MRSAVSVISTISRWAERPALVMISATWSADGTRIVSAGGCQDKSVRTWDAQRGTPLQTLLGHRDDVEAFVYQVRDDLAEVVGVRQPAMHHDDGPAVRRSQLVLVGLDAHHRQTGHCSLYRRYRADERLRARQVGSAAGLGEGKTLIMAVPRLRDAHPCRLLDPRKRSAKQVREAATIKGAMRHGRVVAEEDLPDDHRAAGPGARGHEPQQAPAERWARGTPTAWGSSSMTRARRPIWAAAMSVVPEPPKGSSTTAFATPDDTSRWNSMVRTFH